MKRYLVLIALMLFVSLGSTKAQSCGCDGLVNKSEMLGALSGSYGSTISCATVSWNPNLISEFEDADGVIHQAYDVEVWHGGRGTTLRILCTVTFVQSGPMGPPNCVVHCCWESELSDWDGWPLVR